MRIWSKIAIVDFLKRLAASPCAATCWIGLALLIVIGIVSCINVATLFATTRMRTQLRNSIDSVHETLSIMLEAETEQRGYLLTGNESYLEPMQSFSNEVDAKLDQIEGLARIMPELAPNLEALQSLVAVKLAEFKESVDLMRDKGPAAALQAVQTDRGKRAIDEIRDQVTTIRDAINQRLMQYDRRMTSLLMWTVFLGVLGNVAAGALFTLMFFDRRSELRRRKLLEELGLELTRSAEAMQTQVVAKPAGPTDSLGQRSRNPPEFTISLQDHVLLESDKEVDRLKQQARDLAAFVETSRIQTLMQSAGKIAAMLQQARDLARSVETVRIETLNQSVKTIKELGQQSQDLATSVETSRIQTLMQSDKEIEALGQQARDLATTVETSRIETLNKSEKEIEALGKKARDLARSVETSRIQTLMQSDKEIEALGQQARDLATSVEVLRLQTLTQSDNEVKTLGRQARDVANSVERARIQTLNQSNKEIQKLNEELEQRVVDRTAQLDAANKELESFSYSISHDLRAPLRAIDGFSRIVIEEFSDSMAGEGKIYLNRVRDNTRQMGRLVDDLLTFAHLGRTAIDKHSVAPGEIVRNCLADMAKEQEGRIIDIVIGDLPACQADPILLKQVWTNLLSNALKYTRKQPTARIEIGFRTEALLPMNGNGNGNGLAHKDGSTPTGAEPKVVYFVKDNGAGFDMKHAKKLFGVFERLHRSADFDGTGVGLAIVRRIVERHGGRIWAAAQVNHGATFSFTLN